ncbi:MAG: Gfo/Idh/MocA family oxidoreductase [Clostridiaceae bacterium]|nr:Gfo/Idh/MocA family oxidoreductase [Clostridiaceae bacterium]
MDKLRIGIIGCGNIAVNKHLPALVKIPEAELAAFCDIIQARAVSAAQKFGAPEAKVYTDYKEVLADPSIDAIHVLTPNREHSFITVEALHAGKHVMCEKPMAINAIEAKKMLDAAQETGKLLTIGYQNRCRPEYQYLKRACENGDLGEIYFAKAHALRRRAVPLWGVFINEYEQGGGPLIDIGTHALDLTLWTMNNYKPVMVVGSAYKKLSDQKETGNVWGDWDPKEYTVEDSAFGFIKMANGASIYLESSWALNILDAEEAAITLCGTKAGADLHDGLRINGVRYDRQYIDKPDMQIGGVAFTGGKNKGTPADIESNTWVNAILKGTPLRVLPEQAYVVSLILDAVYESSRTGKAVYLTT